MNEKFVKFTQEGKIEWSGFNNVYELIGFLQTEIFQNFEHPTFKTFMEKTFNVQAPLKETPLENPLKEELSSSKEEPINESLVVETLKKEETPKEEKKSFFSSLVKKWWERS